MTRRRPRILFVHSRNVRFHQIDRAVLAEIGEVRDWYQPGRWRNPLRLLPLVARSDLIFGWFISWHAVLPILFGRLLGVPTVWVVGGFDTARMPEIGYGLQRGALARRVSRLLMRTVTRLITNSQWSARELATNVGIEPAHVTVVYHGLPDTAADVDLRAPRDALALTVGVVARDNFERKGLLPFVRAAAHLADVRFVVAGPWQGDAVDVLRSQATPNVEFTGWLADDVLDALYRRAAVYVQASRHEGFGLSVAEAMLAGCIPVVTRAGALPELVDEVGLAVSQPDPRELADAIVRAMSMGEEARRAVRRRVLDHFPLSIRREGIRSVVVPLLRRRSAVDGHRATG
ncbi:MAG TPA: glycosyltransferase family 4 protein [Candidatus Limnocylindria bacterium]|nr:glycosyltransferase family 4 protein [Candidatus Limnocylindria bacterium]